MTHTFKGARVKPSTLYTSVKKLIKSRWCFSQLLSHITFPSFLSCLPMFCSGLHQLFLFIPTTIRSNLFHKNCIIKTLALKFWKYIFISYPPKVQRKISNSLGFYFLKKNKHCFKNKIKIFLGIPRVKVVLGETALKIKT